MFNYSNNQLLKLLEDCHFHTTDYSNWEKGRKFIVSSINQSGTILDIGCANGFLLKCFDEWQNHKLTPYGIDTDSDLVNKAKDLFSEHGANFIVLSIENISEISRHGLPDKYNLIYWNVWDNRDFLSEDHLNLLKNVQNHLLPGGRLILGFYHPQKDKNLIRIDQLKTHGVVPSGILENPSDSSEVICWFDH